MGVGRAGTKELRQPHAARRREDAGRRWSEAVAEERETPALWLLPCRLKWALVQALGTPLHL